MIETTQAFTKVQTCGRKRSYDNRKQAKHWAQKARSRSNGKRLVPYVCDVCGFYHLQSRRKRIDRSAFKRLGGS